MLRADAAYDLARQCYIRRTCRVLDTPSIEAAERDWCKLDPFDRQRELEVVYFLEREIGRADVPVRVT